MGHIRSALRNRTGGETVEAALVLPIVLMVIFAGMEFGWLVLRGVQLDAAARLGSREAALSGSSATSVQQAVDASLASSGIDVYQVLLEPTDPNSAAAGTPVKVIVSAEYAEVGLLGLENLMPLPERLTGTSSMLKEDP